MPDTSTPTRDDLVRILAEVSHQTWLRHMRERRADEARGIPYVPMPPDHPDVTQHDVDRAEDIVEKLEDLGLWPVKEVQCR